MQPRRQLLAGGRRLPIGKRALDILSVLAEATGEIVTKDELLEAVWPGVTVEENALQVHIVALRKALGPEAERLRTIRGVGYQLEIDREGERGESRSGPTAGLPPVRTPRIAWPQATRARVAALLAVLVLVLAGGWAILGPSIWPGADRPIPVVVRALAASGTGDQTETALAGGITDELILRLRRLPGLRIATAETDGMVSSEAFEDAYVVDGNIRSSGDRLRVNARLVKPSGEILWSQTFDRNLSDLFELQELIASNIAGALSVSLDVGANSVAYGGTDNPEAYAAYVQGRIHALDFDQSVPVRYLERAVALDPGYVQAHAALASTYGNRVPTATSRAEANRLMAEMDAASARALAANPDIWNSNVVRGWYDVTRKDLSAAEAHMRRAAELDQGIDPDLRVALAQYAVTMGRSKEALSIIESNALIDPVHENAAGKIFFLMMNGRYRQAVELYDDLAADEQQGLQAQLYHAFWARVLTGEEAEALEFLSTHMPNIAEELRTFDQRGEFLDMELPQLRRWAGETFGHGGQFALANTALAAAYRGHDRLAVDLLRLAFERPGGYALFYLWHPAMAEARETDAFERLVTDLGFVEVWRESGDWGDYCRPVSNTEITCT